MGSVKRREWTWVVVVAVLIVAASTLPYVVGYLAQTPEWRFGGSLMDTVDYNSYLAKMRQGYEGAWRYQLAFTPEPHQGGYVMTFYLALGHIAHLVGLGLPLTYQLARIIFGFLMLLAVYRFVALLVAPVRTRRVAFLLGVIASGLGWLGQALAPTPPGGVSPIDFWLLDAYTYLAILIVPHFSAAIALFSSILILLLRREEGPNLPEAGVAVLASLALGLIHPYVLVLVDLIPSVYWGLRWLRRREMNWRGVVTVGAMGVTQLPILFYDLWLFRTQPVFTSWSAQNVTLSPPIGSYLLGYGTLLALASIGVAVWIRGGWPGLAIPLVWIGLVAVLTQLPWNMQRRFLEGVQVPLGLLAGVGIAEGLFTVPREGQLGRLRWFAMASLVVLLTISNLYLTVGYAVAAGARSPMLFWTSDVLAAVDWLGDHSAAEDTVLSSFEIGNLIPGRTGNRVVLGHWMETANYNEKQDAVTGFYSSLTSDQQRMAILDQYRVAYVFHGPVEEEMGEFDPARVDYLSLVSRNGDVSVYRVDLPQ